MVHDMFLIFGFRIQNSGFKMKKVVTSPYTALILLLLRERPLTSVEIAEASGLQPSAANAYLHYYKRRGLVAKREGLWELTDKGKAYVDMHIDYFKRLVSRFGIKIHKDESRMIKDRRQILLDQIEEWAGPEVSSKCWTLIEFLVHLRLDRGLRYFEATNGSLEDSLAQLLEEWSGSSYVSPFQVRECLQDLRARGVVYIWKWRKVKLHTMLERRAGLI